MTIALRTPGAGRLDDAIAALRAWQSDDAAMQLHPGDVGWLHRFGAGRTAAATRTWSRDDRIVAVGMLDGDRLLRMTTAPEARRDPGLARRLADDLADPSRGVLPEGTVSVEAPADALLQDLLAESGWDVDEPWTPLRRDLSAPVEDPGMRIEVVGPELAGARAAVQRAAFDRSTFTEDGWHAMAAGSAYRDARCLLGFDGDGAAVAAVTVWSAGAGRPGLIEPMGVHRDHRGRGYGRAITVAGVAALRGLGSSSALVCTESSNVGAVATYRSAGFAPMPEVRDRRRDVKHP